MSYIVQPVIVKKLFFEPCKPKIDDTFIFVVNFNEKLVCFILNFHKNAFPRNSTAYTPQKRPTMFVFFSICKSLATFSKHQVVAIALTTPTSRYFLLKTGTKFIQACTLLS